METLMLARAVRVLWFCVRQGISIFPAFLRAFMWAMVGSEVEIITSHGKLGKHHEKFTEMDGSGKRDVSRDWCGGRRIHLVSRDHNYNLDFGQE